MSETRNGTPAYKVSYPAATLDRLAVWGRVAHQLGIGDAYQAALAGIDDQLRTGPAAWGEPKYDLHGMRVTVFLKLTPILVVHYAIHAESRNVFVRDVLLAPGTPLSDAADAGPL